MISRRSLLAFAALAPALVKASSLMALSRLPLRWAVVRVYSHEPKLLYGQHQFPVDIAYGLVTETLRVPVRVDGTISLPARLAGRHAEVLYEAA